MTAGKVTGGGYVEDGERTSFGFVVRSDGSDGTVQFQLHAGDDQFQASTLTSLSVTGGHATWTATGDWNGTGGYRITVTVEDVGPPRKGARDSIRIVIEAPNGSIVFTTSGSLVGGNIVIH
jgi:hypothetical protein